MRCTTASSTAPAWDSCPRRSSDRPASPHMRGFDFGCCSKVVPRHWPGFVPAAGPAVACLRWCACPVPRRRHRRRCRYRRRRRLRRRPLPPLVALSLEPAVPACGDGGALLGDARLSIPMRYMTFPDNLSHELFNC